MGINDDDGRESFVEMSKFERQKKKMVRRREPRALIQLGEGEGDLVRQAWRKARRRGSARRTLDP